MHAIGREGCKEEAHDNIQICQVSVRSEVLALQKRKQEESHGTEDDDIRAKKLKIQSFSGDMISHANDLNLLQSRVIQVFHGYPGICQENLNCPW